MPSHDDFNQIASPLNDTSTNNNLNKDDLKFMLEDIMKLSEKPECADVINNMSRRYKKCKTLSQKLNVLATGGITNKNILAVQSRIAKNSHKNRYGIMALRNTNSKPRSLISAIRANVRNKQTQSKK